MTGSVSSRRGFMAALAAFTGAGATGAVTVGAAVARAQQPDAELIIAEERWLQATKLLSEAERRSSDAAKGKEAFVGPCPPELRVDWHWQFMNKINTRATPLRWENWNGGETAEVFQSWTGPTLRAAIAALPGTYGRAGRTPNLIRYLRTLIPMADARDTAWDVAEVQFGSRSFVAAEKVLQEAVNDARERILAIPATTLAGTAVKARYAKRWLCDRRTGYSLKQPDCMMAVLAAVLDVSGSPIAFDGEA